MGKKSLRQVTISSTDFNKILESFPARIVTLNDKDFKSGYSGYSEKNKIHYDGSEYLICTESHLNYVIPMDKYEPWRQVIVRSMEEQEIGTIEDDITGTIAVNRMNKILHKVYKDEEIKTILESYTNEYDSSLKQYHYQGFQDGYSEIHNCIKYDINGAHTDALCEMFPKAKEYIMKEHEKRKTNPIIKKVFNYYVGMLKHRGYKGAYNWIVQRTTRKLFDKIWHIGGRLLYANTDGFLVTNPDNIDPTSSELGDFKIEHQGTVYAYVDKNYFIMDCDGKLTGTALGSVRKYFDLPNEIVVHYDRKQNEFNQFYAENIVQEVLI